jgi:sulfate adenylyltransferase subunit 1 (EFTu-like GTPase family)
VTVSKTRPLIFDRYVENRGTGSFILIDRSSNFTAGAGMISDPLRDRSARTSKPTAAERLARVARAAGTDAEAIEAVRKTLEELLS